MPCPPSKMPPRSSLVWSGGTPVLTARMSHALSVSIISSCGEDPKYLWYGRDLPKVNLLSLTKNPNTFDRLSRQSSQGGTSQRRVLSSQSLRNATTFGLSPHTSAPGCHTCGGHRGGRVNSNPPKRVLELPCCPLSSQGMHAPRIPFG